MRRYCTLGFRAAVSLLKRCRAKLDLIPADLICVQLIAHVHACFQTDTYQNWPCVGLSWLAVFRHLIAAIDGTDAGETAGTATRPHYPLSKRVLETCLRLQSPNWWEESGDFKFTALSLCLFPSFRRLPVDGWWESGTNFSDLQGSVRLGESDIASSIPTPALTAGDNTSQQQLSRRRRSVWDEGLWCGGGSLWRIKSRPN